MAITTPAPLASAFARTFGATAGSNAQTGEGEPKPKAKLWLNIGYLAPHVLEGETDRRFIALPAGIPLDTTKAIEIKGQNQIYNAMVSAQNDLLVDLTEAAEKLAPGESMIIGDPEAGLVLQLRRVNDAPAAVDPNSNPLVRRLNLAPASVEEPVG